tara:strand:- start:235 stop:435 length:201 start_codon:yes stop_codon:yes gene_type:complete
MIFIIIFSPYTVMSPIVFEILLNLILKDLNGNIALGILIMANVPKPIVSSVTIKINVKNPIRVDFM